MSSRMWARGRAGLCSLIVCAAVVSAQEKKPAEDGVRHARRVS
jgi:hypothetical protein